jgi:hypothetical protein
MKKLFIIIIFFISFQALSKADDIRDFEIEGMSIGDSLLDFMTENQIKDALKSKFSFYYTDKFVTISGWDIKDKFTTYDNVGFVLKLDDESYKIFALEGTFVTQNGNIQDCYKKQNTIANDVKKILKTKYERDTWFLDKNRIKKHQLSVRYIDYKSANNRKPISIVCYDVNKDGDEYTRLTVAIDSLEFDQVLGTQ